ncbi:hypothetical protein Npun_CF056 (plasmid) [Nostoc punctiforme PCC 73102]|uniref:Uncharacterized protein n=2 Tax=Nostoc punctiforme TaxID=272131 RepID=B2JBU0_NOSP7|nr:hypothetical protein Npun_CF056 [Nostoc punctiforme PCC 73102]
MILLLASILYNISYSHLISMSNKHDSEFERALNAAKNASYSDKKAAAKSPNSFLDFLRNLGLRTLANNLSDWIRDNWSTIVDWIL